MPGDLKEEVKKFLQFAEDKVIKHQVWCEVGFRCRIFVFQNVQAAYDIFSVTYSQAFKLFDVDGDGVVTVAELGRVLARAGAGRGGEEAARRLLETADSDGNCVIDYAEFEQLWAQLRGDTEVDS